ncbi:MAG: hypothetical protein N2691_02345 [Patescibacteria group bacterium]|nr:hypothetical protein [Patescibacteria group bacterium]
MRRIFNVFLIALAFGFTIMAPLFGLFSFIVVLMLVTASGGVLATVTGIAIVGGSSIVFLMLFVLGAIAKLGKQILTVLIIWIAVWGILAGSIAYLLAKPGLEEHSKRMRSSNSAGMQTVPSPHQPSTETKPLLKQQPNVFTG